MNSVLSVVPEALRIKQIELSRPREYENSMGIVKDGNYSMKEYLVAIRNIFTELPKLVD
jgi:hypothetical protein